MAEKKDLIIIPSTDEEYKCWKPKGNEKVANNIKYVEISNLTQDFNKIIVIEPCNRNPNTATEKIQSLYQQNIINLQESIILFHAYPNKLYKDSQILRDQLKVQDVRPYNLGIPLDQYMGKVKEYMIKVREYLVNLNPNLKNYIA